MFYLRWIVMGAVLLLVFSNTIAANTNRSSWLVVVSTQSGVETLTQKQVMSLFLGRSRFLPGGHKVTALDHPIGSEMRAGFYHALTGKNISDIDAYWARLKYSGRASPPLPVETAEQIIEILNQENGAIAYLPSSFETFLAKKGIKTVLTM